MRQGDLVVRIDKAASAFGHRTNYPPADFWNKIQASHQFFTTFNNNVQELESLAPMIRANTERESVKQLVIGVCTAIEVFFKDLVVTLCDSNFPGLNTEGMNELLTEKISLSEARELFSKKECTTGMLIASGHYFLSLAEIDFVLTRLTGYKFLDSIERYRFTANAAEAAIYGKSHLCLIEELPGWRANLTGLFEARHEYVHQVDFQTPFNLLERYTDVQKSINAAAILVGACNQSFGLESLIKPKRI